MPMLRHFSSFKINETKLNKFFKEKKIYAGKQESKTYRSVAFDVMTVAVVMDDKVIASVEVIEYPMNVVNVTFVVI